MVVMVYGYSTLFALLATLVMIAQHILVGSPASWLTILAPVIVVEGSLLSHVVCGLCYEAWHGHR